MTLSRIRCKATVIKSRFVGINLRFTGIKKWLVRITLKIAMIKLRPVNCGFSGIKSRFAGIKM